MSMLETTKNEQDRIHALRRYHILDTPPDGAFDKITALAAQLFNVPIAVISLVDTDRIWFKSRHGLEAQEVDRTPGLCASVILNDVPYVLTDASIDPRSLANPLVAGELGFRFYAGVPLTTHDNHNLGVLCVIDFEPRTINEEKINILNTLAQVVMDEMELRLAARRIDELNKELELLIHSTGEGIFGLDRNLNTTFWNITAEKMTGFSHQEILNRKTHTMFHHTKVDGTSFHEEDCPIYRSIIEGVTEEVAKDIFWRKDGTHFPVEYISTPIFQDGQVAGAVVTFKDITERKKTEELLRRSDKLKTVGQLAAGMAHEIRNPLTTIKGFLQMLSKESAPPHYLNTMKEELSRIECITNEFIVLSKPHAVRFDKKEVISILRSIKTLLDSEANLNNMSIELYYDGQNSSIYCDENQLKQVFINVIKNAMDSMPKGGKVMIESTTLHNKVLIRVIDHGCGMDSERIKHLGEPFYSTKEKGTGLGLMVSYKIIEEHQGEIEIQSELYKGTTVDIILPRHEP